MDKKNETNIETSTEFSEMTNKKKCDYETYFCAKDYVSFEELESYVKEEYISFFRFLEKTKALTINLYAEYVNFFDKGNGIFRISHCYSIKEVDQCDFISPYFNSFLKLINLQIKNCIHLKNLDEFHQNVSFFYSNYECFLRKFQMFIQTKDLVELEMTIKKTKETEESILKHFNNLNYQLEKKFLEYTEIIDIVISVMVSNSELNPKEQGRLVIENAKDDGWKILSSKAKDRKAKESGITRVGRKVKNAKYSKRNIKNNDEKIKNEFLNNKDSIYNSDNLFYDFKDNIEEVKREEIEFMDESATFLKNIALSENLTDKSVWGVQTLNEDKLFISNSTSKLNLEGSYEETAPIWFYSLINLGLLLFIGFVGIFTAVRCYLRKQRNKTIIRRNQEF